MEFEYHLTVQDIEETDRQAFVDFCKSLSVKPLLIVLDKGNYISQPMCTGVIRDVDFPRANQEIDKMITLFEEKGYKMMRKKIETSPHEEHYFNQPPQQLFKPYFEWHGKIEVEDVERVKKLCEGLGGHLSRNSLNANGKVRFITVREYTSKPKFYARVQDIHAILQVNHIDIIKQQHELCIYDSRVELDRGWVT
ncbi:hypothetical protein IC620_04920 [Hazenella sp. IB182357]|uniref:Uncharacterized protein n=1 Tax=Polycladospora coralii TaxID=2771432 RepID=A0A926RSQ2_9BACL|nr:hypothetical protein [Polycladospora coralii]MBD1371700.1 hypothetical protein [Polycladospora coralii]MBS7529167.1 hypothetical protein [Polycladospora coralii]